MARPIDADYLMERLNRKKAGPANKRYTEGFNDCLMRVRSMVHSMPTLTPPNEWVSVEERLPGVSGNYICAVKDKNGSVWTIPAEWSLEMKMWIGAFGEIKNIVTHWMPLPKSPKEDE